MTDTITPLEEYDGVLVKREDQYDPSLPSGKLRGLVPYLTDLRERDRITGVVNAGATKSNSHLIVAHAARMVGLQAVTIVNSDRHHPATLAAREAGAEVILTQPMHLAPLKARAHRVAVARSLGRYGERWTALPWGLADQAIARHYAEAVAELRGPVFSDPVIHVVPMGAAGWTLGVWYGVQLYRPRDLVYAVPVMPTNERNDTNRILALMARHRPRQATGQLPDRLQLLYSTRTEATPWPSDPAYEHVAWPVALDLAAGDGWGAQRVVFWSIGQALR